jgi:hypothetical protein
MSPAVLRRLSLGYNEILADIYWLRALQYFGGKRYAEKDPELLYAYFDIITDLDPRFINAYRYGGTFLADYPPVGLGDVDRGIMLFEKGRANNPDDFRLPLEEAFIWYIYAKNYEKAAELFMDAASKPNLSDFRRASLRGMAALAHSKGGDRALALRVWQYIYENTTTRGRKEYALYNIKKLRSMDIEDKLTQALKDFEARFGRLPRDVEELVAAKTIEKVPQDPLGGRFIVVPKLKVVKSTARVYEELTFATGFLTSRAQKYKRIYGTYPRSMEELRGYVSEDPSIEFPQHPLGENYNYNPETGVVEAGRVSSAQ